MAEFQGRMQEEKAQVEWQNSQQEAFDKLKGLCSEALILAYADYNKTFRVYKNTSEIGLGAVISQKQEDNEHMIASVSRSLNKAK